MTDQVQTVDEAIRALGGTTATAKLANTTPQAVSNWRTRGRFPPQTFLILSPALERAGKNAPTALWGMREQRVGAGS